MSSWTLNASCALITALKARSERLEVLRNCSLRVCPNLCAFGGHLTFLDVSYNSIECLGSEMGDLINLVHLKADHNQIRTISAEIRRMEKLETLQLQRNLLESLPVEMSQLPKLETLNVSGNRLHTISVDILGLPTLKRLHSINNPLVFPAKGVAVCGLTATRQEYGIHVQSLHDVGSDVELEDSCFESADERDLTISSLPLDDRIFVNRTTSQRHHVMVKTEDAQALIPLTDAAANKANQFNIETLHSSLYFPSLEVNEMLISPIIALEPHGSHFLDSDPALVWIKHSGEPGNNQKVIALVSDTPTCDTPSWHPIDACNYVVSRQYVIIKTTHFSLFTAKLLDPYPEVSQHVQAGKSATISMPAFPGLTIQIPGTCVDDDVTVTLKVLHSNDDVSLASPIVKITPHGYNFNANSPKPVKVTLPIPNLVAICKKSINIQLLHKSSDGADWELWPGPINMESVGCHGRLTFTTMHFSYFKAIFDECILLLRQAQLGAIYYYNQLRGFNVQLMCKAFMTEIGSDQSFSVCLMCYQFGQEPVQIGNYPITLSSAQRKILRVGDIQVRLKGHFFGLVEVDETLIKEIHFDGRNFTIEFAVRAETTKPKWGVIGKIFVESIVNKQYKFDLNLVLRKDVNKADEMHVVSHDLTDLESTLSQELEDQLSLDGVHLVSQQLSLPFSESFADMVKAAKQKGISTAQLGRAIRQVADTKRRISLSSSDDPDDTRDSGISFSFPYSTPSSHSSTTSHRSRPARRKRNRYSSDNKEISDQDLIELSDQLGDDWKKLGRRLGFQPQDIQEFDNMDGSLTDKSHSMLDAWRRRDGENCTYGVLYRALGKTRLMGLARLMDNS
eukprot:m.32303 g.32303  ORF g.32303 m.32303 type:complete len:848 (+) comp31624_c0_seq1:92-2635(+)